MSLSERIRTAMDAAGVSQAALARACGVKPPSVSGWLSGKSKFLRGENLLMAARALNVSEDWLATGRGDMAQGASRRAEIPENESPFFDEPVDMVPAGSVRVGASIPSVPIPIIKLRLRAGISGYTEEPDIHDGDHGILDVPLDVINDMRLDPRELMVLRIKGMSMEPMMFEDDKVVVNKANRTAVSREVFAINWNGEAVVKMLLKRGSEWYMHSMNPDFGPINVRSGQCSIVGHVVWQPGRALTGRL